MLQGCDNTMWSTMHTGQIISPQRLYDSGMNFADRDTLSRSFDVHAARVLKCTNCHYALNNPVYYYEAHETRPEHLIFDPRRMDLGEYLYRPLHEFAKGESVQSTLAPEFDNTLRRCESCHSIEATHDWLPYKTRHTERLSCEACHVPQLYAPTRQYLDWTVLNLDGAPQVGCRGFDVKGDTFANTLIEGYEPGLLPRQEADGSTSLAPYNLITYWLWVYGEAGDARPTSEARNQGVPQPLRGRYPVGGRAFPGLFPDRRRLGCVGRHEPHTCLCRGPGRASAR
jgi:hypothetical protein